MLETTSNIELLDADIKWISDAEVLYTTGPAFSFISPNLEQCHPVVTCKDYLGDMVFVFHNNGKLTRTNGHFTYCEKECPSISMDKIRIIFCNRQDSYFSSSIDKTIDIIHQTEDAFKIDRSVIKKVRNPMNSYKKTGIYMFIGSSDWMSSPVMLSLYTLLMRIGKHHVINRSWLESIALIPETSADYEICIKSLPHIDMLAKKDWREVLGTDLKKNYPSGINENYTHGNFGIYAFSIGYSRDYCPHWYPKN